LFDNIQGSFNFTDLLNNVSTTAEIDLFKTKTECQDYRP